ncbi:hypothetical protein [Marinilabilia rubra]|uniref:Uncharacterized protein n=1 Tax=Marinilabilia rubra TaxID=2162893 RepID=A0A2U2B8V3_9BACT|nr:hypothetical protein [Marinilabilia rubra]PWD99511.1 hypothetical protein DDZ16_10945 [Marinilabilia rubra]
MKKLALSLALITGMAFAATSLQAQNNGGNDTKQETTQNVRSGFVDNNGDGVCDNYDGNRPGKGLGPGNGQGQGRRNGKGLGHCGNGNRQGRGQGRGGNGNFVDNNENGTCDNLENGTGRQRLQDGSGKGQGSPRNN